MSESLPTAIVIRLSAFGDVLLTAGFIHHLSRSHRVLFITGPAYQHIAAHLPGVDEVLCLHKNDSASQREQLLKHLNQSHPAVVYDLQNKLRTFFFRRKIQAQRYVTLSKRTWQQGLMALLGSDTVLDNEHQSSRYLNILNDDGASTPLLPDLRDLPPAWQEQANQTLKQFAPAAGKPTVGLAFGATHPTKGWPIAHLTGLIEMMQGEVNWILIGGPNDLGRLEKIKAVLGGATPIDTCHNSIEELTGIVSQLSCLIGVDTGPMHLARLCNVPTVTLFGPTSIKRWGPGPFSSPQHRVASLNLPCQPCSNHGDTLCPLEHHACMKDLQPERVAEEARAILGASL